MFALVASPAFKPASDFDFLRDTRANEADKIARTIADLHGALVNPNTAPGAAVTAKRTLLGVLQRTKWMRLPFMIVPPIAERSAPATGEIHGEPLAADSVCETCERPVAPPFERSADSSAKSARTSSSPRYRASHSRNRGALAVSRRPVLGQPQSRQAKLHEPAEYS